MNNFFVAGYERNIKIHTFSNNYQLCNELTGKLISIISKNKSVKKNICLCGGSTPIFLYQSLFRKRVNWHKVEIVMTDERLVNEGHIKSNKKMLIDIFSKCQISHRPNVLFYNDGNFLIYEEIQEHYYLCMQEDFPLNNVPLPEPLN